MCSNYRFFSTGPDARAFREKLPKLEGTHRQKALDHLGSTTKTRTDPKTKETHYLLHRGYGKNEYIDTSADDKVEHQNKSSWTPHEDVAQDFADSYTSESDKERYNTKVSAWVPESNIHTIPMHHPSVDEDTKKRYAGEHEVIVAPGEFDEHFAMDD